MRFDNDQWSYYRGHIRNNVAMRLLFYVYRLGVWSCVLVMSYTGTAHRFVFTYQKYVILYRILRNAFLFVYAVFFDNDHRDACIRGMDAFDNDQWCLLQVYMVGSITTSRGHHIRKQTLRCDSNYTYIG